MSLLDRVCDDDIEILRDVAQAAADNPATGLPQDVRQRLLATLRRLDGPAVCADGSKVVSAEHGTWHG